jgi:hypothetical protein
MTKKLANAYPRKHFFLEMFTRDISLEDCVLDLIDNSIDGLVRTREIDISSSLLDEANAKNFPPSAGLPRIEVSYTKSHFEIKDTCGGIPRDHALKDVFNFGHSPDAMGGVLGVYGVGLKRAIFKLGENFEMKSRTVDNGFDVNLNVREWSKKDDALDDWRIPITFASSAPSLKKAGTSIRVTNLRKEVTMRMDDGTFQERLKSVISQTYGLFIKRYVIITLNGLELEPFQIPLAASAEVQPAHDVFEEHGVRVELFASLAERKNQQWKAEPAGWYVLCNGRIVVAADKGELTGWGTAGFPQFHDGKFRGFVGVAFFKAKDPALLPWTTTKRGLNRESPVYQSARNRMRGIGRPIITFLDSMYKREMPEEKVEREIADQVKPVSLASIAAQPTTNFTLTPTKRAPKTTVKIQYDAEKVDIERIRKHLKKFTLGANKVGQHTFEFYMKNECPE